MPFSLKGTSSSKEDKKGQMPKEVSYSNPAVEAVKFEHSERKNPPPKEPNRLTKERKDKGSKKGKEKEKR
ncbi:hypothetical protein O1611_g10393 [Lasiodiplodia mahajangana]|uniref:Uncharacterized protein n=1 Tax=Lasiodiplodia mahajangana TaxID=1108764 RepID=A0ACC2IYS5_9PEZI|nr:hypothetical protein O1611_g10393 [Lasiodiplodia mahajangana]